MEFKERGLGIPSKNLALRKHMSITGSMRCLSLIGTDATWRLSLVCLLMRVIAKVSNGAKIRNRYNQVPHLTQDTNGKVTNSQKTPQTRAKRSALSQQVTTKHI